MRQLEVFLAVARAGSFRRAAERAHLLLDRAGVGDAEVHRDAGLLALERAHQHRQEVEARRRARADDEGAPRAARQVGDGLLRAVQRRQHPERVILQDPPRLGQRHRAPAPLEEARAEPALELAHVLGQRRLTQVDALGRPPKTPGAGHGQEHLELSHRGWHKLQLIGRIRTLDWRLCKTRR